MSVVNVVLHTQVWINAVRPASLVPALKSKHFGSPTPELYKVWTTTQHHGSEKERIVELVGGAGSHTQTQKSCVHFFSSRTTNRIAGGCTVQVCRYSPTVSLPIGGQMAV